MYFRPAAGFNKSPLPLPKDILDVVKRLTGQGAVSAPPFQKTGFAKQKRLARTAVVS